MNNATPRVFPMIGSLSHPGRQLFGYHIFLLLLIILTKAVALELNSRFDIALFPRLFTSVQMVLDHTSRFDEAAHTVVSLLYSFLFSFPIAIVYGVTKDEKRFDPSLAQTTVLLSMVVTGVMLVIADQMARAFGLAGVVAAVRFRNSLDDAKDAVYVFLAIVIGMACGARVYPIALWTSMIMTTVLYFMWRYRFGQLPGQLLASPESEATDFKYRKGKKDKKDKKPNAVLVVEALDLGPAQRHAEDILATRGKWRLAKRTKGGGISGSLEFAGRIAKGLQPAEVTQGLLDGEGSAFIESVELHSRKGQAALKAAQVHETGDQGH